MDENQFIKVAFTLPYCFSEEAWHIIRLLESGFDFIHIRKPESELSEVTNLIELIPANYHSRLRLHDYPELMKQYNITGFHLTRRYPVVPACCRNISRSCHSINELYSAVPYDCVLEYQTLSPIFDSISKNGYLSKFRLDQLRDKIRNKRVVALGGVTPGHFPILKDTGFYGAAMLGAVWNNVVIK